VAAVPTDPLVDFDEIWVVDFEYRGGDSGNPCGVVCVAAKELRSGRSLKLWLDGQAPAQPPYRIDERALFVCFAATAECGAHLALGWPLPARVLDLSPEYRNYANGRVRKSEPRGLINALEHFGLPHISKSEKDFWREIVLRGPPYTDEEKLGILDYCFSDDVLGTEALLWRMLPKIKDPQRAIKLRSEFVKISAQMAFNGIPIDTEVFTYLRDEESWNRIREALVLVLERLTASMMAITSTKTSLRPISRESKFRGRGWPPASSNSRRQSSANALKPLNRSPTFMNSEA
jgi:hypothetical protein